MPLPTDPLLTQQWHLHNPVAGLLDLNVFGVWNPVEGPAYSGAGTRTVVIDDGFDYLHSDLAPVYDTGLDYDFDQADLDPFGTASDAHGTAVTGIIGAAANGTGAVGVAYGTSIVGYRTHGFITDFWLQNIRDAIHHAAVSAQGDVVNISQGIANDFASEFGFGYSAVRFDEIENSIATAVAQGRGGLGMTIVKSAGNSRLEWNGSAYVQSFYDINVDDWSNDTRQVVVAAVDQNGFVSSYSSYGAALLVSAFGTPGQVVTTDRTGSAGYNSTDFTSGFNGTSAAAPMVTGVVSLMLDANPGLGWRDVQSILASSARQVGSEVGAGPSGSELFTWGWNASRTWNGGGMHFSNDYGYGLVDALGAVRLAETWLLAGGVAQTNGNEFTNTMDMVNAATVIPDGNTTGLTFTGSAGFNDIVDRVTVRMTFSTTFTSDLEVYLISPGGTVSRLVADAGGSMDYSGTWTFESQAFRGERALGTWSVRVVDDAGSDVLTVSDLVVTTWGASTVNDRYIFTNEYSDYAGVGGHATAVSDSNGGTDTVNAAAVSSASVIRLDGVAGSIDGVAVTFANIENAIGGDGGDTIHGSGVANMLFGMRGADDIHGGDGNDTIEGGTGNDTLDGGSSNDSLYGGDGDDVLSQSTGSSTELMDGGAGSDTGDWSYNNFGFPWTIDLTAGTAVATGTTYATLVSIENVVGTQNDDLIVGDGNSNRLDGQNGNDTINADGGNDSLYGGEGDDVLSQGTGFSTELMDGGNGNDTGDWSYNNFGFPWTIDLSTGTAVASGTTWATLVSIENVVGTQNNDVIVGSTAANQLDGHIGNDTINAGDGDDTLLGGAGVDSLSGGEGNDRLSQGAGNVNEVMDGGAGSDTGDWSYSTTTAWTINLTGGRALVGSVVHTKFTSIENAIGGALGDFIFGNTAANRLEGLAGDDTLNGGRGTDSLYGGEGNDVLIQNFGGPNEVMDGGNGSDTGDWSYSTTDAWTIDLTAGEARIGEMVFAQLTSIENAVGGQLGDSLTGSGADNRLDGQGGDDTINAGGGTDTVTAGAGNDRLLDTDFVTFDTYDGGGGTDWIDYSGITFASGFITIDLDAEVVSVAMTDGHTETIFNFENVSGSQGGETIVGSWESNELLGNGGDDTIRGGAGNDTLDGGSGNDTMVGGTGNDVYVVDSALDALNETSAIADEVDTVRASVSRTLGANFERLELTGADAINGNGNELANLLIGNDAANILDGRGGVDTMIGGLGGDTFIVDSASDVVTETSTLVGEIDTVRSSVSRTLGANIERLLLTGSSPINGTGNELANLIIGNDAANLLDGRAGSDSLIGGLGNDIYIVDSVADSIFESSTVVSEIDTVRASVSRALPANFENLELTGTLGISGVGNALNNVITGNAGANLLNGLAGADTMIGGLGGDTFVVDDAGDATVETSTLAGEIDTVQSTISRGLWANIERLLLVGGAPINGTGNGLNNEMIGNSAANVLNGADGSDSLSGGGGNDTLVGGTGADSLNGDAGNDRLFAGVDAVEDRFVFDTALNPAANVDLIVEGEFGEDQILLSSTIFSELRSTTGTPTGTLGGAFYFEGVGFSGNGAADDVGIWYDLATGRLFYNPTDGLAGDSVLFAIINGATSTLSNVEITLFG